MKKNKIIIFSALFLICISLYTVFTFLMHNNSNLQSIYLVPNDAVYIMETKEPIDNWNTISESDIWKYLNTNTYFNSLAESLNKLDAVFKQQQGVLNFIGNRDLLISAHVYSPKKYGFLYIIDLQKIAKLNLVKNNLNSFVNTDFKVSKRKYHEHEITEIYDIKEKETLYMCFIENQMIASYVHTLVESSIDQYLEPEIGRNHSFIEVKKHVDYEGMFRLYFQYKYLQQFASVFSNNTGDLTKLLGNSLNFSGFYFDLDNNTITANGITNTKLKASAYLKAVQKSGKGKRSIAEVAPKETALYLSFSFSSFSDLYRNFETIQREDSENFKSYLDGIEKIENFLKIDLKENFMSWIDDEIALLQIHSKVSKSKKDVALVLKTNNIGDAEKNLNLILEQIRKRSPAKFKAINYKGHTIKFMSIKGFFKVVLGNLFKSIDKPYFTIIDDYVVFSNHPNTLKSIINTYTNRETLDTFEAFTSFNDEFNSRSSVFAYINTYSLYQSVYNFSNPETKNKLKKNKDFLICFPQIGIQLTAEDDFFDSKIRINYEDIKTLKNKYSFTDTQDLLQKQNTAKIIEITKNNVNSETVFNIPEIYPTDLTANRFIKKYRNGNIKFSVELKDGLKHGDYKEFYPNKTLKISGRYKKDEQIGAWKAYNYEGDLVFKKRF